MTPPRCCSRVHRLPVRLKLGRLDVNASDDGGDAVPLDARLTLAAGFAFSGKLGLPR